MGYALVLVEGDTEVYFYTRVKSIYKNSAKAKIINLEGNFNINQKVLDRVYQFDQAHPKESFSVLICIDNESRSGKAPINLDYIKKEIESFNSFSSDRVHLFLAKQDIESWFFHDIDNIYKFLRVQNKKRTKKFRPVEAFNNTHLSELFKKNGKQYNKGHRSENFIDNLDIEVIKSGSSEFNDFCEMLKKF